jgi:hypothetical protein
MVSNNHHVAAHCGYCLQYPGLQITEEEEEELHQSSQMRLIRSIKATYIQMQHMGST